MLKQEWKEGLKINEALELAAKVLTKTMDTANPTSEKLEFGVVEKTASGAIKFRLLKDAETNKLMADAAPKEGESKEDM